VNANYKFLLLTLVPS